MKPIYDFTGRVALVTGASQGIGLATARAFAASGAAVVLADRHEAPLMAAVDALVAAGHEATAFICDVSIEAQARALVACAVETYGRLDMAYNNAGIIGPWGAITEETEEGFDGVHDVNLKGVWACLKHELIQMEKQGSGSIVNCSSLGGLVGLPNRAAYHSSKHGVLGLTKCAALDFAAKNIRVNAVCPGTIETPMSSGIDEAALSEILREQSIGRLGHADEIAAAVLWLCSDGASFVLGVGLPVDGGFTVH